MEPKKVQEKLLGNFRSVRNFNIACKKR